MKYSGMWFFRIFRPENVVLTAVTMVTRDGTTIAVPTQQGRTGRHVTMVTDGKEMQQVGIMGWIRVLHGYQSSSHSLVFAFILQVAIVTSDGIMTEGNSSPYQQVALLATENGTQIAVQVNTKHIPQTKCASVVLSINKYLKIIEVCLKWDYLTVNCMLQLEDQQTLEEAITMATAAIQHNGLTSDQWQLKNTDAFLMISSLFLPALSQ